MPIKDIQSFKSIKKEFRFAIRIKETQKYIAYEKY